MLRRLLDIDYCCKAHYLRCLLGHNYAFVKIYLNINPLFLFLSLNMYFLLIVFWTGLFWLIFRKHMLLTGFTSVFHFYTLIPLTLSKLFGNTSRNEHCSCYLKDRWWWWWGWWKLAEFVSFIPPCVITFSRTCQTFIRSHRVFPFNFSRKLLIEGWTEIGRQFNCFQFSALFLCFFLLYSHFHSLCDQERR